MIQENKTEEKAVKVTAKVQLSLAYRSAGRLQCQCFPMGSVLVPLRIVEALRAYKHPGGISDFEAMERNETVKVEAYEPPVEKKPVEKEPKK